MCVTGASQQVAQLHENELHDDDDDDSLHNSPIFLYVNLPEYWPLYKKLIFRINTDMFLLQLT